MNTFEWTAIIGALAWTPQIGSWICKWFTKSKVSLYLHTQPEIGYTSLGPIFNIQLALISEKKDATLNKFVVTLRHESGASYTFEWDGISEDLSQIEDYEGSIQSVRKVSLPLVVRVLKTNVAQAFVRYQLMSYKDKHRGVLETATNCFNTLKSSGKLKTEEDIDDLTSIKEFDDLLKHYDSEFIWMTGKYTVTFDFNSTSSIKYKKEKYVFHLTHEDVTELRKNLDNIKLSLLQTAKGAIMPDFQAQKIPWNWRHPALKKTNPS
jgi:hypothetical protein